MRGGARGGAPARGIDFFFVNAEDGNTYPCGTRTRQPREVLGPRRAEIDKAAACADCDWECFGIRPIDRPGAGGLCSARACRPRLAGSGTSGCGWTTCYCRACQYFDGHGPSPRLLREFFAPAQPLPEATYA